MSLSFATFGNDLYTGKRSIPVVPLRRRFYLASLVMIVIAVLGLVTQGLNLGLEFRGGSEFRVATTAAPGDYEKVARDAVGVAEGDRGVNVTLVGNNTVRVQTEKLSDTDSQKVRTDLAQAFGVAESEVSGTFIGPSWGASVSQQALRALVIFLLAVALLMTVYFRNWKMAAAGLIALAHDLIITVGIYAWTGFEVTPATMIGFLTVLGYSLYDTVVVFDKVRENTNEAFANGRLTFAQAANLAVNQTMVRSINTTVIGLLPITAVLIVGAIFLGPGVLLDLSLVLFVGILIGAYSSIFIATPLLVTLRRRDTRVVELEKKAERYQARKAKDVAAAEAAHAAGELAGEPVAVGSGAPAAAEGEGATLTGRAVHKYASQTTTGPRNQPRRTPKSKR
jgi:preprotein translocase subunit SecF